MTPGVLLSVGVSGSGKTYGIKRAVYRAAAAGVRVIVIDRMREWDRGDAAASTAREAEVAFMKGSRLTIWRCRDAAAAAEQAAAWVRDVDGLAGLAIPEAHRIARNSAPLPPALEDCVTAWRHYRVRLWLDTQRLALLNRTITEQSTELRLHAIVGDLDVRAVREFGGRALSDAVQEAAARLGRGEAGWFVRLGLSRVPPYRLEREA